MNTANPDLSGLHTEPPIACDEVRAVCLDLLVGNAPVGKSGASDGSWRERLAARPDVEEHLLVCSACSSAVDDLREIDEELVLGLRLRARAAVRHQDTRIAATIREVEAGPTAATLLRRGRRLTRTLLWIALISLAFTGSALLAVAAYRALLGG